MPIPRGILVGAAVFVFFLQSSGFWVGSIPLSALVPSLSPFYSSDAVLVSLHIVCPSVSSILSSFFLSLSSVLFKLAFSS
jgi:hypothetical protein